MRYDDDNLIDDEDEHDEHDEYDGYSVLDDEGNEMSVSRSNPKGKKEENWDDGEIPEASPIPENEQTVMIDNADVSGLSAGSTLTLLLSEASGSVYCGAQKIGDLKPALVQKLREARKGMYVSCEPVSINPPVMVKLKFYAKPGHNTVKID